MKNITLFLTATLLLIGCSDSATEKAAPSSVVESKNEVKVKQETEKLVAETPKTTPNGKDVYSTCHSCHGVAGEGGIGPKLKGVDSNEIIKKLKDYRDGKQIGPMTAVMAPNALSLSDEDIEAVALYISTL